jgi:8-oxo-dGTP pyrophosphatase MutT (NUDIX family)
MIEEIIKNISDYQAETSAQNALKVQFEQFIKANPTNCLLRENLTGHLTASAWVIDSETRRHALLVKHVKLQRWLQPGGHADGDPDLIEVACKELQEETGIIAKPISNQIFDLDTHAIPWHKDVPPHLHFDVRFLFTVSIKTPLTLSDESHELRWVEVNKLAEYGVDQSVLRLGEKSLDYLLKRN